MNAGKLRDHAVRTLKASPSIDHWQKHRERWEADELLMHVLGGGFDLKDDVVPLSAQLSDRASLNLFPILEGG